MSKIYVLNVDIVKNVVMCVKIVKKIYLTKKNKNVDCAKNIVMKCVWISIIVTIAKNN